MGPRACIVAGACALAAGCLRLQDPGEPWPCDGDTACAEGELCKTRSTGDSICMDRFACEDFGDCRRLTSTTYLCVEGTCVDCSSACGGYQCDDGTEGCFTTCLTYRECAEGHGCQKGECHPVGWLGPAETLVCSDLTNSPCGAERCIAGECRATCNVHTECGDSAVCYRSFGASEESGNCLPLGGRTPLGSVVCSPETETIHCGNGLGCDSITCRQACSQDRECQVGYRCVGGDHCEPH
jgi:hypothetical protein